MKQFSKKINLHLGYPFEQLCWVLFLFLWTLPSITFTQNSVNSEKINGISFTGPKQPPLTCEMLEDVKISNANWITFIPKATLDRYTLDLLSDEENDNWSETIAANIQAIQYAKRLGLKIMLKPHIVLNKPLTKNAIQRINYRNKKKVFKDKTGKATWRGEIEPKKEENWKILEKSYENYILTLATIADTMNVELFCIGSELRQFTSKRNSFWKELIQKVRLTYAGKITYSANWDEYNKITFWNELDYIGVDTYFPINNESIPSVKKTVQSWGWYLKQIRKVSKKYNRPVLITEFGYRNIEYAGQKPWLHDYGKDPINNRAQINLYEAFFESFWKKEWVVGGFLWQWFSEPKEEGNTTFSPQGKPALDVIRKWYGE